MNKEILRKDYLNKRQKLSKEEYDKKNKNILNLFIKHFIISSKTKLHIYLSRNETKEVDTWQILKEIEKKEPLVCVPKINSNFELINCILNKNTILEKNIFKIEEPIKYKILNPKKLHLIIVPAIICDKRGFRIGYGKGYYDRFLRTCDKNALKIALTFFEPLKQIDDININDISMNYNITPNGIIKF
ncbi:MAG: 5-formyltetrahydrofolate cyclo-ligase [Bacteroidetes bacterium]|nr:5-formyltetrahydrofolate cyclo-ligase [Bacteroidota bacterium]